MTAEEKIENLIQILKWILPKGTFTPIGFQENGKISHIHLTINDGNIQFKKSRYIVDPKNRIVHFTKLDSLRKIIEKKNIRLYNLNKMNDPIEFSYAAKLFGEDIITINSSRSEIYCLSCCEEAILFKNRKVDQFNQWRLYGDNGFGAIIVFQIENDILKWIDYHISKVFYGDEMTDRINEFRTLSKRLKKLNEDKPTITFDFGKLICFHKSGIYSVEEEVRLIFDNRRCRKSEGSEEDSVSPNIIEEDKVKNIKYLELGLLEANQGNLPINTPALRIAKIIIGYQYENKQYTTIKRQIENICESNLGYLPKVERTKIYSHFWGKR